MLSFLLIVSIAYGIAYWISSTGIAYWRAIVGFMLAFTAAWLGGGYLTSVFLFPSGGAGHSMSQLIAKAMVWALIGAGYGIYQGRLVLRTGSPAPSVNFPKWAPKIMGGVAVVGIAAAVALPAYQDYTKRQESSIATPDLVEIAMLTPAKEQPDAAIAKAQTDELHDAATLPPDSPPPVDVTQHQDIGTRVDAFRTRAVRPPSPPPVADIQADKYNPSLDLDRNAVKDTMQSYESGGISKVQIDVENCYQNIYQAAKEPTAGEVTKYCVALDLAGFQLDKMITTARNWPQQPYFLQEAVSRRTHQALAVSAPSPFQR